MVTACRGRSEFSSEPTWSVSANMTMRFFSSRTRSGSSQYDCTDTQPANQWQQEAGHIARKQLPAQTDGDALGQSRSERDCATSRKLTSRRSARLAGRSRRRRGDGTLAKVELQRSSEPQGGPGALFLRRPPAVRAALRPVSIILRLIYK